MSSNYPLVPIASITTPFKQKFAIPRQPGLANAQGVITFNEGFDDENMLKGIEDYSHLWMLFVFHQNIDKGWKSTVKAPRLGGNATMGVFATRSTHRPNGIGMSVVKNKGLKKHNGKTCLIVEGVDIVDGTPLVDIKPYIAYADNISHATDKLNDYNPIPNREVVFHDTISLKVTNVEQAHPGFTALVTHVLSQDPRPAYKQHLNDDIKTYKVSLYDVDVGFQVKGGNVVVTEINPL